VLAAEHLLDLASLHFLIELFQPSGEFVVDRLSRGRPFSEHGKVVGALLQRGGEIAVLFETTTALQHALGFGLVFPEVRRGRAGLKAAQFFGGRRDVKDSSADRQRGR
jgi:hypothetical protein